MGSPITIPANQLKYLQADLAISNDQAIFSDDQLDDNWVRSGAKYDVALALSIFQLLMDSAKWTDYTAGQTSEKQSQTYDMLLKTYNVVLEQTNRKKQFSVIGLRAVPPRRKARPYQQSIRYNGVSSDQGVVFHSTFDAGGENVINNSDEFTG